MSSNSIFAEFSNSLYVMCCLHSGLSSQSLQRWTWTCMPTNCQVMSTYIHIKSINVSMNHFMTSMKIPLPCCPHGPIGYWAIMQQFYPYMLTGVLTKCHLLVFIHIALVLGLLQVALMTFRTRSVVYISCVCLNNVWLITIMRQNRQSGLSATTL